ncbi:hypothetical protein AAMO2058_001388100 [Amorphochlora amoebiformis]
MGNCQGRLVSEPKAEVKILLDEEKKEAARIFTIRNSNGLEARICDYGAALTYMSVPDQFGQFDDIVLASEELVNLKYNFAYLGATIGRLAARTAGGSFPLNGKTVSLARNHGKHQLHGGNTGFHNTRWKGYQGTSADGEFVDLTHTFPDGEDGYPGDMFVRVRYTLTDANRLEIVTQARCTEDCPINTTNHSYFNLEGHEAGSEGKDGIKSHRIRVFSNRYVAVDQDMIATGELLDVDGTALDLRQSTPLKQGLYALRRNKTTNGGYDHTFVIDKKMSSDFGTPSIRSPSQDEGKKRPWNQCAKSSSIGVPETPLLMAAEVFLRKNGRLLRVYTNQPAVHIYTGNFLNGKQTGKGDISYHQFGGLCLECEELPNTLNLQDSNEDVDPAFTRTIVGPKRKEYESRIVFEFSAVSPALGEL